MKNKLLLETLRTITKSKGKYLTLLLIVFMGVSFFSGMLSISAAMGESVDKYIDEYNFLDFQIYSNYGFDDDDILALKSLDENLKIEASHFIDAEGSFGETSFIFRVEAFNENSEINQLKLVDGHYPTAQNEVLAEIPSDLYITPQIGDKITLTRATSELEEVLTETEFTVVGLVTTPNYMSQEKGPSTLDNLPLNSFLYVPQEIFKSDVYTVTFVQSLDAKALNSFNSAYDEKITAYETLIKDFANTQENLRANKIINEAKTDIENTEQELLATLTALNAQGIDGAAELKGAFDELEKAKAEIENLAQGEWTILTREMHYSIANYKNTVEQMQVIGLIFPVFFFLVAALVCLTTMTRMVDEQRVQIGVLRALGYSRLACASKYLLYALSATLIGGITGAIIGIAFFPQIVYMTWGIMYNLPPINFAFPWFNMLAAILIFIILMGLTTFSAIRVETSEVASALLRPKAPPAGKRIFLEKMPFLWRNFSFTAKITARNIIRYKKRFFMTVAGISGCTCLLVSGFGMRDSIANIAQIQYEELTLHTATISAQKDLENDAFNTLLSDVKNTQTDISAVPLLSYSSTVSSKNNDVIAYLQVYENNEQLKQMNILRDFSTGTALTLDDNALYINQKLAELLLVKVGDTITIESQNGTEKTATITGIFEKYINHEIYISNYFYQELFDEKPEYNSIQIKAKDYENTLQNDILSIDNVSGIVFNSSVISSFSSITQSMDIVVIVIIVSAAALAFVVLSNLANINISERKREIATLKVLGFNHVETKDYIFKENLVLTLFGAIMGIFLGIWAHYFIITQVEMDFLMFVRNVSPLSIVFSVGLTFVFSAVINRIMLAKLKQIDMIDSLKSVE